MTLARPTVFIVHRFLHALPASAPSPPRAATSLSTIDNLHIDPACINILKQDAIILDVDDKLLPTLGADIGLRLLVFEVDQLVGEPGLELVVAEVRFLFAGCFCRWW